jgi:nicotinamidase-related amidase
MTQLPANAALLIIDLQQAIDHPSWGRRNNPEAEQNIGRLLQRWRSSGRPVFHVRHVSTEPDSTYRPNQPCCEFKAIVRPLPGEAVIEKSVNCAFIGTELENTLKEQGIDTCVIVGVITNNSVEATARVAGNLGFVTCVVSDATATFDKLDLDGKLHPAEEVHALSLANLHGEYATVIDTEKVLALCALPI